METDIWTSPLFKMHPSIFSAVRKPTTLPIVVLTWQLNSSEQNHLAEIALQK